MRGSLMATMAMALGSLHQERNIGLDDSRDLSKKGIEEAVEEGNLKYKRLLLEKKGVQVFEIDGKMVLARNLKNAQKKAAKG